MQMYDKQAGNIFVLSEGNMKSELWSLAVQNQALQFWRSKKIQRKLPEYHHLLRVIHVW